MDIRGFVLGGVGTFFLLFFGLAQAAEFQMMIVPESGKPVASNANSGSISTASFHVLRPSDRSASNAFKSTTTFYVIVVDVWTGAIVPNAYVWLTPQSRPNGGGHDHHDNSRPPGEYDRYEGSTGSDGWQFQVTYTAPEVSGPVDTYVACSSPSGYCYGGTFSLYVQVDGLVPLNAGLNYNLVGSYGMPGVGSRHISNHNGRPSFTSSLVYLADLYYFQYGSKLEYNDLSLPLGGLFDVFNNWRPDHWEHRMGISADLRLVPVARRNQLRNLLKAASIVGTTKIHRDHWHIREFGSTN